MKAVASADLYVSILFRMKALTLLRTQPIKFFSTLRMVVLFKWTSFLLIFFKIPNLKLGKNVRIQSLNCLSAELPSAKVEIADHAIIYEHARIASYKTGELKIGHSCIIGDAKIYCRNKIEIGNYVITSWNVFIQDFDPHPIEPELRQIQMQNMVAQFRPSSTALQTKPLDWNFSSQPIFIGNNVWIGANVTILKGANIGNDSVIATGSVVTAGTYPDRSILAGIPAKVIKTI